MLQKVNGRLCKFFFPSSPLFVVIPALLLFATPAVAHRVYVFAWVEGDTVHTESYFSSERKVRQGLVKVLDLKGRELLQGQTDNQGHFSFPLPGDQPLRIVVEAGMGHAGEFVLQPGGRQQQSSSLPPLTHLSQQISTENETDCSPELIRSIIQEELSAYLKPLLRQTARSSIREPGWREAVSGLGYIFGLLGIYLYIRNKLTGRKQS